MNDSTNSLTRQVFHYAAAFISALVIICAIPATAVAQDDPFIVSVQNETAPDLPESSPAYSTNGSFEVSITDGASCPGTLYDIVATPVVDSSPLGNTPAFTIPSVIFNATAAGSPYLFSQAGAGEYSIQVFEIGACDPETNPEVTLATIPDGAYDDPFVVTIQNETAPGLPESAPGYLADGSFEVSITDGASCPGTLYDIVATPVVDSSPLGNTPAFTIPSVIFNATAAGSPYLFSQAGAGEYTIQVFEIGACDPETNPEVTSAIIPDGAYDDPFVVTIQNELSPQLIEGDPGYIPNGSFEVTITDGASCPGTIYNVVATPVVASSPLGNTPSSPVPNLVINATAAGSPYLFSQAGAGEYTIEVTETGACDPEINPEITSATIPNAAFVSVPVNSPLALIFLILFMGFLGIDAVRRRAKQFS